MSLSSRSKGLREQSLRPGWGTEGAGPGRAGEGQGARQPGRCDLQGPWLPSPDTLRVDTHRGAH